jgi:tetratricopeptide (TPR) repeat protein
VWVRDEPTARRRDASGSAAPRAELPAELVTSVRAATTDRTAVAREHLVEGLQAAVDAYNRGRYEEAARRIAPVVLATPGIAGVREVAGLASYRARRWRTAIEHLRAYTALADDVTHLPAWMDCERALGHPRNVSKLYEKVRAASPSPEVLAEARIVMASSLADRGGIGQAIELLLDAGADKRIRNPAERHVRQWYVLADLFERTGDVPRARELFTRVALADPGAYDVDERLEELGGRASTTQRRRRGR